MATACDRIDLVRQQQGRLLRVLTVPIHRKENWIDVTFRVDRHLTLHVSAAGPIARTQCEDYVQQLNFGFKMPVLGPTPEEVT